MEEYSRKHKKEKKKRKHSEHKKEKKKRIHSQHKQSSSESEDEWVEKKNDVETTSSKKHDDWMSVDMDFSSLGKKKEDRKVEKKERQIVEEPGQSSRELNPYWRDGGTGLPPEKKKSSLNFGNNRSLEECRLLKRENDELNNGTGRIKTLSNKVFKKPQYGDNDYFSIDRINNKKQDQEGRNKINAPTSSPSKQRWKKENAQTTNSNSNQESLRSKPVDLQKNIPSSSSSEEMYLVNREDQKPLSADEMNKLSAKIIKAEIMGNMKLAEELRTQLEKARNVSVNVNTNEQQKSQVIILTETDSKGFTRPLKNIREERVNSKKKVVTHEENKRVRYFADDDSQSLKQMFEKERFSSTQEQNATFIKLMGKELTGKDEDAFEETASMGNVSRNERKNWNDAIKEHSNREKALENCYWCLDSKSMNQDVIVAIRNQAQLCVPSCQSLTDAHCVILPCEHISCATNLDEDVWDDIMNLRKHLVKIFQAKGEDVIFFECASNLDKFPHMQLHCVPIPKEIGELAPIYFKKAILECEMEWSNNKKVVDLKGRDVRKAVPKGLPYFAVDFGLQPGYAHVIEDRKLFPNNFAQEIIGGMLDIDYSKWRKLRKDSEENIKTKAKLLKELIQEHL